LLGRHGIPVIADLPGVGTRCRDHPQLFLGLEPTRPLPPSTPTGVVEVSLDTVIDGAPIAVMPYLRSMAEMVPGSGASTTELVVGVLLERADSVVDITVTSSDPRVPPSIDYHSLESGADRAHLTAAAGNALSILDSAELAGLGLRRTSPARVRSLDSWVRDNVTTAVHLCSSAPMGPDNDPFAVVDQRCRVRGVDGLRVVDTSILPTAPSRGPACTAVLIGERAAAFFE
jgi:choline dehydrogenase